MKKSDISALNTLANLGTGNFQGIDIGALQQRSLAMQQQLAQNIQQRFAMYPQIALQQANQAFHCSYVATEDLCEYLSNSLDTALWLDNPAIINNPMYNEEMLKSIQEQASDAFKKLPQNIGYLQQKKSSLISTANVLQEQLVAIQANTQQIEQDFPKLVKAKQLEMKADLVLQKAAAVLASKQLVDNASIAGTYLTAPERKKVNSPRMTP